MLNFNKIVETFKPASASKLDELRLEPHFRSVKYNKHDDTITIWTTWNRMADRKRWANKYIEIDANLAPNLVRYERFKGYNSSSIIIKYSDGARKLRDHFVCDVFSIRLKFKGNEISPEEILRGVKLIGLKEK